MKKLYCLCLFLITIPLLLVGCKNNTTVSPVVLNRVDIGAITNENLNSIIKDDSLEEGIYLIESPSNQYVYFLGKDVQYIDISCSLEDKNLNIISNTDYIDIDKTEDKKLYIITQKNNTSSSEKNQFFNTITLSVNNKETNFKDILKYEKQ